MVKWTVSLGLGLVLSLAPQASAQDPFSTYEPPENDTGAVILEAPDQDQEGPIIRNRPARNTPATFAKSKMSSRSENAHLRDGRTPAQEYIHQRAVFHAQQRAQRMEWRKRQGISTLRPDNRPDKSWWYTYSTPVWDYQFK